MRRLVSHRWSSSLSQYPLFSKILIANRGEIACRIMRTAKKLGIKTVAVYSEADRYSMHVDMADEAFCIGPAASAQSYLQMEKIIQVAKESGAQAIHPGYGFLSENPEFANRVTNANLVFIGPPAQAIIDMGSKSASKEIMSKAKVPVVPGYHGKEQSVEFLKSKANDIGYPVLIKAVKGGGGKGMRIVQSPDDFEVMLQSSIREAVKSFGDDKVLVEKYLVRPRHVEVQVFADQLGNAVYLYERDCSVQRRHQKILEEAPAPGLTPELRKSLGEKAVAAAKAVKYVGAGTVEFILDTHDNKFYFMEMNTRLQVEHPITEMVTKTDLVEWQLRVAAGNRLPLLQNEIPLEGHAFEARIYAEDPSNNFLPDTGKLLHLKAPQGEGIRVETGVRELDEVSVHYDPMICKLVVTGKDRLDALRRTRKALEEYEVVGLKTNIEFLKQLVAHPSFIDGDVETGFIAKHHQSLFLNDEKVPHMAFIAAALATKTTVPSQDQDPWSILSEFRLNLDKEEKVMLKHSKNQEDVTPIHFVTARENNQFKVAVGESDHVNVSVLRREGRQLVFEAQGKRYETHVVVESEKIHVFLEGSKYTFYLPNTNYSSLAAGEKKDAITTPMPCKISQVAVKVGDKVQKGQVLVVLEAMKMEHIIRAPVAGTVTKVFFKTGDIVGQNKQLLVVE